MHKAIKIFLVSTVATVMFASCKKDFLDENPRTDLIIPSTLPTLQALLDDDLIMNLTPTLGELSADNYYLTYQYWLALPRPHERNSYIWEKDIYKTQQNVDDWSRSYTQILNANVVLEGLEDVAPTSANLSDWNAIKGSALFFRANAYYNLAQLFAPPYDSSTAGTDLGLPVRTDPDINAHVGRSSVKETYDAIIQYLNEAETLVYSGVQYSNKNRPSKPAVLALKARVYLSMRAYALAGQSANEALNLYDSLINYNDLDPFALLPFSPKNKETIFQSHFTHESHVLSALVYPDVVIDSQLIRLYDPNDLRPQIYYTNLISGQYNIKGSYSGLIYPFTGFATDELYLIRAEANAYANNLTEAMNDIDILLTNRYKTGTYASPAVTTREEVLKLVREERRKELAFRGLRWPDLRRFNKEGENIQLQRVLNGQTYSLEPNSKLYVLPLPPEIITLGKLVQNER